MSKKRNLRFVLVLESNPKQIIKVERFLEQIKQQLHLDESKYFKLLIAVTEAVSNSIIHGNKQASSKKIILTCELNKKSLVVRIHDEGVGIDIIKLPDPLTNENLLRESGRGIFLMRSLMDTVEFVKTTEGGEVVMTMLNITE